MVLALRECSRSTTQSGNKSEPAHSLLLAENFTVSSEDSLTISYSTHSDTKMVSWDDEQRLFLDAARKFTTTWNQVYLLYDEKFGDSFERSGYPRRVQGALSAQYSNQELAKPAWSGLLHSKEWYLEERQDLVSEIRRIAEKTGVTLKISPSDGFAQPFREPATVHPVLERTNSLPSTLRVEESRTAPITEPVVSPTPIQTVNKLGLTGKERFRHVRSSEPWAYIPVPPELAHPATPEIFYRRYDDQSAGINQPFGPGFWSGRHAWLNSGVVAVPKTEHMATFEDFEIHLGNKRQNGDPSKPIASPFVSASSCLLWSIRQAEKIGHHDGRSFRIAFIDGAIAAGPEGRRAFHVPPFYRQLKEHYIFDEGSYRWGGNSEYLFWGHIPPEAIICDFALEELESLCEAIPSVGALLRLEKLRQRGQTDAVVQALKNDKLELNATMLSAIARFVHWTLIFKAPNTLSLDKHHLAKLISEITGRWHIRVKEPYSPSQWANAAEHFAIEMDAKFKSTFHGMQRYDIKAAFLNGLRSGYGEPNWIHSEKETKKMIRRAEAVGLLPAEIILPTQGLTIMNLSSRYAYQPPAGATPRRLIQVNRITTAPLVTPSSTLGRGRSTLQSKRPRAPLTERSKSPSSLDTPTPGTRTRRILESVNIPRRIEIIEIEDDVEEDEDEEVTDSE